MMPASAPRCCSKKLPGAPPPEQIGRNFALPLDVKLPARLKQVLALQQAVRRRADLYAARETGRLDLTCEVDGGAPQVIRELVDADNAGDRRTGVDPDLYSERLGRTGIYRGDLPLHAQGHFGDTFGVIGSRCRKATDSHVGVANRFDLLDSVLVGQTVKQREHLIEKLDELSRAVANRQCARNPARWRREWSRQNTLQRCRSAARFSGALQLTWGTG